MRLDRSWTTIACGLAVLTLPPSAGAAPGVFTFPGGGLIQWVAVSDTTPCAGRPVIVAVGTLDPAGGPVEVYVDGAPGVPQIVQYFGPEAQKKIPLFAITPARVTDSREITIAVQSCPAVQSTLHLLDHKNPFHANRVDFRASFKGKGARTYRWSFGDGQTAVTTTPFVSHDYSASVDPRERFSYFTATVIESSSGLASGRRIALGSSFDLSRSMGFVQADVRTAITQTGQGFIVGLEVANHHKTPIELGRYLKQYLPCDTRSKPRIEDVAAESVFGPGVDVERPPRTLSPGFVTITPGRAVRSRLALPLEKIPADTCVLGFNLIGESTDRKEVYGSFYLQVRRNPRLTVKVTDGPTLLALKQLVESGLVPNPARVTGEDLYLLEQRGQIERTKDGWRRFQ